MTVHMTVQTRADLPMTTGNVRITTASDPRPMPAGPAMWSGFRGRCPACARGAMFRRFLKVNYACPECGEELHHHRADDFPAYLDIAIVGHILVPIVLAVETATAWPFWVAMVLWPTVALGMTLALLQPIKGAVVGMQWALGMHGFEQSRAARAVAGARALTAR